MFWRLRLVLRGFLRSLREEAPLPAPESSPAGQAQRFVPSPQLLRRHLLRSGPGLQARLPAAVPAEARLLQAGSLLRSEARLLQAGSLLRSEARLLRSGADLRSRQRVLLRSVCPQAPRALPDQQDQELVASQEPRLLRRL
jgi:hypothetical protein